MTLQVGVVGFGYWGSKHVRVLSSMADVEVTVIDTTAERRAEAVAVFPRARVVPSLAQVAADLDAVVVATPPGTHAVVAHEAIAHGCSVLVEKPLATSTIEGRTLVVAAEDADVRLMVGHTFLYNDAVEYLAGQVGSGNLGDIRYIDTARLNLGLYQSDVNVIWDLAPHDISITNYLLGATPTAVTAWARAHAPSSHEDVAHLQLHYGSVDVTAYVHVSWLDPCKVRRVTVVGSEKMAVYDDMSANERIRIHDVGPQFSESMSLHGVPETYRYGDITSPNVPFSEPLSTEMNHFLDCVRTGARPKTDGESGLEVVQILEAACRSAIEGGTTISIEPAERMQPAEVR